MRCVILLGSIPIIISSYIQQYSKSSGIWRRCKWIKIDRFYHFLARQKLAISAHLMSRALVLDSLSQVARHWRVFSNFCMIGSSHAIASSPRIAFLCE